ncbi:MAG TPA: TIR domain-containing protein [Ktedonobacteraceae bacterium]|nr:TIR domain-containing protein [Ktedonobacteraceae bacterium]
MAHKTVICYAREDKTFREELERHLSNLRRQQFIISWSDREIAPGAEWKKEIDTQLKTADLILLLISADFMSSEYGYSIEMQQALQRHNAGLARVIPILLRAVDWKNAPFSELQMLPEDARPIVQWRDRDEVWSSVVQEIRRVLDETSQTEEESDTTTPIIQKSSKEHTEREPNGPGKPTVAKPMLLALAIDVSDSMKQPILDHAGKTIQRWTSVRNAVEHFVHLGVSWVQDPQIQEVLPLYYLMAYGFGFKELMHTLGWRKKPGGAVRDLLAHPTLTSLPSTADLDLYWNEYKKHLLSQKEYTGDLFGSTPLRQALVTIRNRIREECKKRSFTLPMLLLLISDGLADEGENPLPIIKDLHAMGVVTLSCYLASKDILASQKLYKKEESHWPEGAKMMFQCASPLHQDNYVMQEMFAYLSDHGWRPQEGARLFAQVNQAQGLDTFLELLLRGSMNEKRA